MTKVFASPTFAKCDANFTLSMKAAAASFPPLTPKQSTAPKQPARKYFFARSWHVHDMYMSFLTPGTVGEGGPEPVSRTKLYGKGTIFTGYRLCGRPP